MHIKVNSLLIGNNQHSQGRNLPFTFVNKSELYILSLKSCDSVFSLILK